MTVILQIKIMLYVDNKVVLTTLIHFLQLQIVKALAWIHFFLCTPMGLRGPAGIIPMSHPWGCVAPNVLTNNSATQRNKNDAHRPLRVWTKVTKVKLLPARRRPQGLVVIGVCLSVCVRTVFVRKISQERVHGSPPNLVGGSRGWTSKRSSILVLIGFRMRIQDHFSLSVKLAG